MAKIHWSVYIIVGALVSALSYRFNYDKLIFFFYFGFVFVFAGIVKLIFSLMNLKSKKEEMHTQTQVHQAHKQHIQHFKRCARCGNVLRISDKFCARCGARV